MSLFYKRVGQRVKLEGLEKLMGALAGTMVVRVGIFGNKESRDTASSKFNAKKQIRKTTGTLSELTNPELGAIHEFGSPKRHIPARSFLRMPIVHESVPILKEASAGAEKLLAEGKMKIVMARLGIAAENAVQLAFATRGFNQWRPDFLATVLRKRSGAPLIDTGQLRRSITSKVVQKK